MIPFDSRIVSILFLRKAGVFESISLLNACVFKFSPKALLIFCEGDLAFKGVRSFVELSFKPIKKI